MVDPAEAKRLAAKQMEAIKKKQTFEVCFVELSVYLFSSDIK